MKRGLWFLAGAGAGIYASVRAKRVKEAFTADGLSDRWHALALGARMFRDEVAQGQAEAETGLRERLGLVPHGHPELAPSEPRQMVGAGVSTRAPAAPGSTTEGRAPAAPGSTTETPATGRRTQEGEN